MQVLAPLEQSNCAFSLTNKRCDNIKMHGKTVKINVNIVAVTSLVS